MDMSLTKEDLQAIQALIQEENAPIAARLDKVDTRLGGLEQGQAELAQNYHKLNQSMVAMEQKLYHNMEIIKEGITGWNERNKQIDRLESGQEDHEHRIWALEQVAKNA